MRFKEKTPVISADGQEVGKVDRVVVQPETRVVTHLVVKKGRLLMNDKVVPIDLVETAADEQVTLRATAEQVDKLADLEETHFVPAEEIGGQTLPSTIQSLFLYPPRNVSWWGPGSLLSSPRQGVEPRYRSTTQRNVPRGEVVLKEGAQVLGRDQKHVGDVAEVFTDSESDEITHLLVSQGLLPKKEKLVPVDWIKEVKGDQVLLSVGSEFVRNLPSYEPEEDTAG